MEYRYQPQLRAFHTNHVNTQRILNLYISSLISQSIVGITVIHKFVPIGNAS